MDKRGKVVMLVLVIVGLVFAMGLGMNLVPKPKPADGQLDRRGWIASLDNLTARFRKNIASERLNPEADCRQLNGGYAFNRDAMECHIRISREAKGTNQMGTLVITNAARVLIPCGKEQESPASRGGASGLQQLKVKPMQIIGPRPDRIDAGGPATGPNNTPTGALLEVVYTPEGQDTLAAKCQGENEIRLVVLKAGGRLSMRCRGCSGSQVVQVRLKE
uniref:hypothetical protein n=1 Tax=Marinobacterium profundum TaxID=1714300 RepID=UPI00082A3500|nr:hypothetical protein [Marinobacterium profundum]